MCLVPFVGFLPFQTEGCVVPRSPTHCALALGALGGRHQGPAGKPRFRRAHLSKVRGGF